MAEILLSSFISVAYDKLVSAAIEKLSNSMGFQAELQNMKMSLSQIETFLYDASKKEITDESVIKWLDSLHHLAYDIDDLLDELATEAMHREFNESEASTSKIRKVASFFSNFPQKYRIINKLNDFKAELQDLENKKKTQGLSLKVERSKNINRRAQTSLVDASSIVGREGDKEALLIKLLEEEPCNQNFSIVPIIGMGGVGKTTLARLLYDDKKVKDHFERKAWVCVSDEFDIFYISKVIFQWVSGENADNKKFADLNLLQVALREQLMGKRFLLVLDDVWSESYEDWDILVRPFLSVAPGSKIIMTTRKDKLLRVLGYSHLNHLQSLSYENALSLFAQHAVGVNNFDSHPTLRPHGEGIVKKCDGLPLALRAIGRLLRTKTDEEEWKELLDSQIWTTQDGGEILPALRLSYNDLSGCLKQLFAYCSLFPKDYMFNKEQLILLWMAEGFLHRSTLSNSVNERLGHECFEELLSRSFFQRVSSEESMFVMHDLINELATFVAGDFFLRLDNESEKDAKKEALENCRHMSVVCDTFVGSKKLKAIENAKKVRTFLAASLKGEKSWESFYLSSKIMVDLCNELPFLRVLCLNFFEISEVPESIGSLKHLRYLNLLRSKIKCLPESLCNLYNLQTLIVFGCRKLTTLPNNFLKLRNLRHFDVRDTPLLNKMPLGIEELKNLRTLSKIIIGGDNGLAITELKNLKYLNGKISIKGLDKVKNANHAREANLLQRRITELELKWSDVFDDSRNETLEKEVLDVIKPHNNNLEKLRILSYGGIEFPKWIGDPSFLRLTHVTIIDCKKCVSLPPFGQLPSLKMLDIRGMHKVKVVGLELLGTSGTFPSLEYLSFDDMIGWEVWSINRGTGTVDALFPCLNQLRITDCPNLVEASTEAMPSLRALRIHSSSYGVLRSLLQVASPVTYFEIRSIAGLNDQLWRGLIEYLGAVEEIRFDRCNDVRYLWESEAAASKVLVNLRVLGIYRCEKLVRLGEKEDDSCGNNLTSLKRLTLYYSGSMEHCSCPNSLKELYIDGCKSLRSISFPTGAQKFERLSIEKCDNLLEKYLGGGTEKAGVLVNKGMPMIELIHIDGWLNLKSINELSCFIHLESLVIENCPTMDSFPNQELTNLTSLNYLSIVNCPNMNASFPRGFWPPNLSNLILGTLKKPMSEWGKQNFPTSLVMIGLFGGPLEELSRCSQLSDFLPSSLTTLFICKFEKLESHSMGLQHLTSLQHVIICDCPKMKDLPETLLPSLLSLTIGNCPRLLKKTSRGGSYWPLVSCIPNLQIY